MDRDALVLLVKKIMAAEGTEEEQDAYIEVLERNVPHPGVSDLIFWPDHEMTAEEIVDMALNYKPIRL